MADSALTAEQILRAAEEVLRRYGPSKATVVDVARALGVSHGSVYRHFATKAALRAAVTSNWLERAHAGLAEIAESDTPAPQRLHEWLTALFAAKRRKAFEDPEMFATYQSLEATTSEPVLAHIERMVGQLARILTDGVAAGQFTAADPLVTARAVWDATDRFHNPVHSGSWDQPGVQDAFEAVCSLVLAGLATAGTEPRRPPRRR
ncbi:TetR family transcriptional regulator [Kutzneria viridogrisea]|uniref:TetR family transcription regulator n=2 Tax=Kutzneria TaxID=43356 RepID=W5W6W1_9PSEU|nr:TetR family transcriptional regulator [Kutzneria albida]AHH93944.1 TetR family transcription regulator [Kutzneria albida DSM 43870]MBA8931051.1 AcrR family transcriptional regulator [Kutzneria viridogrisea]